MVTSQGESLDPLPGASEGSAYTPAGGAASRSHDGSREDSRIPAASFEHVEAVLAPGEGSEDSNAQERLLSDQLVVDFVLAEGLNGPRHKALEDELINYALPVLEYLLRSGQIVAKCHELGRPLGRSYEQQGFSADDFNEFRQEMIARQIPVFTRMVFVDRKWTSRSGGASLTTYFVNGCARQFASIYRKWRRDRAHNLPSGLGLDVGVAATEPDPASRVANLDQSRRLFAQIPDRGMQEVLAWRAIGYTTREAAANSGLTTKAAEGRLSRLRKNLRQGELEPDNPEGEEPGRKVF